MTKAKTALFRVLLLFSACFLCTAAALFFQQNTAIAAETEAVQEITPGDIADMDIERGEHAEVSDNISSDHNVFALTYNADATRLSSPIRILLVLTVISLAPSILVMLTSFTRTIVVLHFTRAAIGTQTSPPNQVLVGLALFLTLFIMWPTFSQVYEKAIVPLDEGTIDQREAFQIGMEPIREFMFEQTQIKDLNLFIDMSGETYEEYTDVPNRVLIPSFILSELRTAFIIGFLIYIPFIVIDMVVSSVLMSMGMMMLPPTTISLPFKILLFVMADGWELIIGSLVKTFR